MRYVMCGTACVRCPLIVFSVSMLESCILQSLCRGSTCMYSQQSVTADVSIAWENNEMPLNV